MMTESKFQGRQSKRRHLALSSPPLTDGSSEGPSVKKKTSFPLLSSPDRWKLRGKKRKQEQREAESLSLCSLDINEPSTKRVKPLFRVTSLASLLPPVKTTPLKRIGQTLQRSISFHPDSRSETVVLPRPWTRPSSATVPVVTKRRDSKLWSDTFDVQPLSAREIKRQEAIFELSQGEQDLVDDLKLAKKAYHDPMLKLSIMTEQELMQIFGTLDSLVPLHEDLLSRLRQARQPDGSTEHVGHILVDWLPCLQSYTGYCSNQVPAKALLDDRKQRDGRVHDFLQRCLLSPFSRKLDLWNFLDIPRSRLVKYPLLLREILKHTPNDHPDRQRLEEAILMVQSIVAEINRQAGESECRYYKNRLSYSEEGQRDALIEHSRTLSCRGELKNHRGVKLHVFLFQDVLVVTRALSLNDQTISYQLCRQPIPIRHLLLEDLSDGEVRVGGSIRGAFSNAERMKNFFRVSYHSGGQPQSLCLQASDLFNKQQWLNCIRQAQQEAAALQVGLDGQTGGTTGQMERVMEAVRLVSGQGVTTDSSPGQNAETAINERETEPSTGGGIDREMDGRISQDIECGLGREMAGEIEKRTDGAINGSITGQIECSPGGITGIGGEMDRQVDGRRMIGEMEHSLGGVVDGEMEDRMGKVSEMGDLGGGRESVQMLNGDTGTGRRTVVGLTGEGEDGVTEEVGDRGNGFKGGEMGMVSGLGGDAEVGSGVDGMRTGELMSEGTRGGEELTMRGEEERGESGDDAEGGRAVHCEEDEVNMDTSDLGEELSVRC